MEIAAQRRALIGRWVRWHEAQVLHWELAALMADRLGRRDGADARRVQAERHWREMWAWRDRMEDAPEA